ncbi:MAG: NYN domain-containing protein [Nocardioides sp.]|nr:NYN domain-containing protein [Nocardioides sp.]
MADRVAVYIDFDNIVISRYDHVHGDGSWRKDGARSHEMNALSDDPVDVKLAQAKVDLRAIIDYATSYGVVGMSRAYADWSVPANAAYRKDLVERAVDLVQLFAAAGTKNGADIRLAVDAVEDLLRHPDITHVALVAGDSDYVPLATRCKRLGRYVVGIGMAGSTSRALVSACDEFESYENLPGVPQKAATAAAPASRRAPAAAPVPDEEPTVRATAKTSANPTTKTATKTTAKAPAKKAAGRAATKKAATPEVEVAPKEPQELVDATALLERAVRVGLQKSDDEWIHAAGVKSQMQRMSPAFKEKSLGFTSFKAFVESRTDVVESKVNKNGQVLVRLA